MRCFTLFLVAFNAIGVAAFAQANPSAHGNSTKPVDISKSATNPSAGKDGDGTGSISFSRSFVAGTPQLGSLTLHQLSPDEAKGLPYSTYYENEEDTCSIMLYDDGSVLLHSMTSLSGGRWLFERWHLSHDALGVYTERVLEVYDGQRVVTATGGQPLFPRICSKAANHDLPKNVKVKFFRMLGVR